jgi:hypothetical protein
MMRMTAILLFTLNVLAADKIATETTLSALNTKVTAVNTGAVVVSSGTLTCNAGSNLNTSLLSTAAKQDTGNTSLSNIDAGIPAALGQTTMTASMPVTLASDQSALSVAQSGTWNIGSISTLPTLANVTTVGTVTSLTQMNGQAIAMGTGLRTAGTQRVTIATDDVVPASQSGTWNIGSISTLPTLANVTTVGTVTSLTQMNGQAISMGTGARAAGTQRVTIATDDVVPASQSGTWNIGTLTNLSQLGGTAVSMNTGVRDAGTQRVTIATNDVVPASQSGTWNIGTASTVTSLTQFNGQNISLNTGVRDAGTLRVSVATNDVVPASQSGTWNIGTTTSLTQFNGQAIALNTGTRSAGTLRVTVATDDVVPTSQSGTWTVQPGNTPNTTAWNVNTNTLGRTELRYYAVAAASGSTGVETAITLTKSSGTSATSSAASQTPTSGKKFRITHFSVATRGNATATIQSTTFNLRVNTAGSCGTSSTPIILSARSATPATASAWDRYVIPLDQGTEIPGDGTLQFCITAAATFTTNAPTWDVTIVGYEY